jgi:hypothetical protein
MLNNFFYDRGFVNLFSKLFVSEPCSQLHLLSE